jgi:hypothetical protein
VVYATPRPRAGALLLLFFFFLDFVIHAMSRFGAISIYIQVESNPPLWHSKKNILLEWLVKVTTVYILKSPVQMSHVCSENHDFGEIVKSPSEKECIASKSSEKKNHICSCTSTYKYCNMWFKTFRFLSGFFYTIPSKMWLALNNFLNSITMLLQADTMCITFLYVGYAVNREL